MRAEAAKQLKKPVLWVIFIAVSVAVWALAFYWIAQPSRAEKYEVWLGADFDLKPALKEDIRGATAPYGIKKCTVERYDPGDAYYAQAFALRANSVDIYILERDMAVTVAETGIFKPLGRDFNADYLVIGGQKCGVKFKGDYYLFVNSASDKPDELHFAVIDALLAGANE